MTIPTITLITILICIIIIAYLSVVVSGRITQLEADLNQAVYTLDKKMRKNMNNMHRLEFIYDPKPKLEKPKAKRGRPRKNKIISDALGK